MQKRSRNKMTKDVDQVAARIAEFQSAREPQKNPAAVALGRLGGLKGGKARMKKLSPERRREIASNAARTRWAKER
jgi:predicted KAP-like P-loop ATPase